MADYIAELRRLATTCEFGAFLEEAQQQKTQCHRCLGTGHSAALCRFKTTRCNKCRRIGHISTCMQDETLSVPPKTTSATRVW